MKLPLGWTITHNPKPIPSKRWDWDYVHDDFDAELDNGEWVGNGLCGSAESYEEAVRQIMEIEEEREG